MDAGLGQPLRATLASCSNAFVAACFRPDADAASAAPASTAAAAFRSALDGLLAKLGECELQHVRCLKSNQEAKPDMINR